MRKKGSVSEFSAERDCELIECFRKRLAEVKLINLPQIYREVAQMPTKRFYVSEFRAACMIRHFRRYGEWNVKGSLRREMFAEIERRVSLLQAAKGKMSLDEAVFEVVNSAAPKFYLTPRSCRTMIYKLLKSSKWIG